MLLSVTSSFFTEQVIKVYVKSNARTGIYANVEFQFIAHQSIRLFASTPKKKKKDNR